MDMNQLIISITDALASNTAISDWSLEQYARPCTVLENIDLRSPPDEEDCPLVAVHPVNKSAGLRDKRSHGVGITALVFDETRVKEENGVIRFAGTRQVESLRQLALAAVLGSIPGGCRLESVAVDYDTIEQFPFCWAGMSLTITQENTLGMGQSFYE